MGFASAEQGPTRFPGCAQTAPGRRRRRTVAGERLLIRLLKPAGITGWKANFPVAGYRLDVAFPATRTAVEVDGLAFHTETDDFHHDRIRQNAIALAGWQVLRFTWLDLTEQPQRVIGEIEWATR